MTVYRCTICGRGGIRGAVAVGTHYDREHATKPSSWESAAIEAVKTLAATQRPFTIFECEPICGPPANPKADWGRLAAKAHRLGLIERLGYQQGSRPTVKGSAVALWSGKAAA